MTSRASSRLSLPLFSFTLFLSAAAMFALQPMVGKMLLPVVGGTPSGWIVAMAFFQVMLLAGYLCAHMLSHLTPRAHGMAYIGILLLGLPFLPVFLGAEDGGGTPEAFDVFRMLTLTTAVPFIALSATSSTIQRLFTATGHMNSGDPYFLYAASNLGSFAGLFLYPLAIEPFFTLTQQTQFWFACYLLLIASGLFCLTHARGKMEKTVDIDSRVDWKLRCQWILLALVPSSLLLGVTTLITTDIISAPMLWVLPLGLYLLTFVIAFARRQFVSLRIIQRLHPTAVAVTIALPTILGTVFAVSWYAMTFHLVAFMIAALMCHMRLAALRPVSGDNKGLTDFYLMIALGGALGGMLNAFVVPVVTDRLIEYTSMMLLSCLLNPLFSTPFSKKYLLSYLGAAFIVITLVALQETGFEALRFLKPVLFCIFILATFHPKAALIAGFLLFFVIYGRTNNPDIRLEARNFYGIVRVHDASRMDGFVKWKMRYMTHGSTTHGIQILDAGHEKTPTSYFTEGGPMGTVFRALDPEKVLTLGLGAGTINCYATPEREMTFIEIDPLVVDLAKTQFTFLSDCKGKKEPRVIIGDGRIEIGRLEGEKFDLIILDAFSADMVPIHLVTREAVQLYLKRLNDNGVLLFNISSRYFSLENFLGAVGKAEGLESSYIMDPVYEGAPYVYASKWIAMARSKETLVKLGRKWVPVKPPEGTPVWTDTYSSFLPAIEMPR